MKRQSFRRFVFALAIGASLGVANAGQTQTVISGQSEIDQQAKSKASEQLARRFDVDLQEATLADLAKFVSERTGLNVLIDEEALEESGVELDKAAITVRGQSLPLVGIFDHALDQQRLTWQVQHGALLITTREESEQSGLELQVYPIGDLVSVDAGPSDEPSEFDDYDVLMHLLITTVAPDSWDEVGGPGAVSVLPNRAALVISQTREVHESVERLLAALRATAPAKPMARAVQSQHTVATRGSRAIGAPVEGSSRRQRAETPAKTFQRTKAAPRWLLPRTYE